MALRRGGMLVHPMYERPLVVHGPILDAIDRLGEAPRAPRALEREGDAGHLDTEANGKDR